MRLKRLLLAGFRNLEDAHLQFPPDGVAVIGRNAQGKTNLLEAIHYLETLRSFRKARDEELVCFGQPLFRIEAESEDEAGERRTISAAFRQNPRSKRVLLDGERVMRLGEAVGSLATVLFTPEDVRLVRDGPAERRRFLDLVLSVNEPGYLRALQTFRHALAQRNAALRDRGGVEEVFAWDSVLTQSGAAVSWTRATWVREFAAAFGERYREISGDATVKMAYEPSIAGVSEMRSAEEVADEYLATLASSRDQEFRRRMTLSGPHRDDLSFSGGQGGAEGRDLRAYGSGGERRTGALALRLLEVETARVRRGRDAILLLDDVFAELDDERSRRVLALLDRLVPGQVILTAPKESDVKFRADLLPRWSIEGGEIKS